MDRQSFSCASGLIDSGSLFSSKKQAQRFTRFAAEYIRSSENTTPFGSGAILPDVGWRTWPDVKAEWQNDRIYLPENTILARLPVNLPTGAWDVLNEQRRLTITLPTTVERFYWGLTGFRSYKGEYKFEATDSKVKNGAYYGVSGWWREIDIFSHWEGKRIHAAHSVRSSAGEGLPEPATCRVFHHGRASI